MPSDQPPRVEGDGLQSRDFTYIDNIPAATCWPATPGIAGTSTSRVQGRINLLEMIDGLNRPRAKHPAPFLIHVQDETSTCSIDKVGYSVMCQHPFEEGWRARGMVSDDHARSAP
jgi:hypothetical protein